MISAPSWTLSRRQVVRERLRVRVRGDELDARQTRLDHGVQRVAAAAADTDDLDRGLLVERPSNSSSS